MRTTVHTTTKVALTFLAAVSPAFGHDADPRNDGWITHVDGNRLEICNWAAAPAAGQSMQILRTSFITPNKGPVREKFSPGGTAKVTAATGEEGCITAELISGSAKRSDHARVVADKSSPQ